MKAKCKIKKNKIGDIVVGILVFAIPLIFLATAMGCSKSDDGVTVTAISKVIIKSKSPNTPASLKFDEEVILIYDYEIADPNGGRIWIQPYTNGGISPKYSYTSSPLLTGKGTRTVMVSITSGTNSVVVDQLLIKIASSDGNQTVSESFEAVNYTFSN
ncbi:hypothetical protein DHD05_00975 [Arenibacter sp. N53]|uniref:hypothetical protein n=1 Tax=Arenibacter TaxID=178469 RepID=UPI000CD3FBE4|nr:MULTISPECIES: hypothetical protein [Arenibacter]MCM4150148.1 hypothetical protein [Arenibacter sp. N53]